VWGTRMRPWGRNAIALVLCLASAGAADPPHYVKRATWQETLRLSREALMRHEAEAAEALAADPAARAFEPFTAELKPGDKPMRLRVRVAGLKTLCLRVTRSGEKRRGRATVCFGSPRLFPATGKAAAVTRKMVAAVLGNRHFGDERDRRWQQAKLDAEAPAPGHGGDDGIDALREAEGGGRPAGRFTSGFFQGCDGELVLRLDAKYERLEAWLCLLPSESTRDQPVRVTAGLRSLIGEKEESEKARQALWERVCRDFAGPVEAREQAIEQRSRIWDEAWTPGDVKALAARYARNTDGEVRARAQDLAKAAATPADLAAVRALYYLRQARERLAFARKTLELVERAAPRPKLAAELAALEKAVELATKRPDAVDPDLPRRAFTIRRRIILSHPLLDFDRLLINKRVLPRYNHMCDQYLGRHSGIGAGLVVLDNWKTEPRETVLLDGKLPPGAHHHPDLSFDGTRILFSYCDHTPRDARHRRFWIYEIGVDGTGLRQLTGTPTDPREGWGGRQTVLIEDWDPCYLPGGGFAFISTRSQTFGRCHGSRYVPTYMVFRANADGSDIRQLSFGEANEWDPSILPDGRIIYTRWDYINRHDTIFQSLWTMRPDGTATAHFFGNYSRGPCMIAEARAIPNSHKIVATATDHHGYTAGSIIVIDTARGQDQAPPLFGVTPELGWPEGGAPRGTPFAPHPPNGEEPPVGHIMGGRRAATPFPLSEELFLAAYAHGDHMAIYLIDTLGGRELLYRDPTASCFAPIPIRPTPRPPVLQSTVANTRRETTGIFHLQDIYQSTELLPRGVIRRLRINRIYGQPTRSKPALSLANNEIIKGILGTVPVRDDGSVTFRAPAGMPLQFQALDANGMAVMTMRSFVYLQPGETMSCVGCHEPRSSPPPPESLPHKMAICEIEPPAGPQYEGGFSFARTVQPVLDRYCIRCHGLDKKEANLDLLGTRTRYSQAHDSLTSRSGFVAIAYRNRESAFSKPRDYFAHAGRLAKYLLYDHRRYVELDRDSFQRIVNWLDLNAQFYGDYSHNRIEQRHDGNGEKALRKHVAETFGEELARQPFAALVNVALPTESRILMAPLAIQAGGWGQIAKGGWKSRDDPGYQKMLELVRGCRATMGRHDIAGTCGGGKRCSCGCCWVRELRKTYTASR